MADANATTLRRGYEALNRGDVSEVLALLAPDLDWQSGQTIEADGGQTRASFERFLASWLESFEEFHIEPEEVIERGDHLIAVVRQAGRGRMSGAEVVIRIAHVWTVRDGRAVRWRGYANRDAALAAIASD